MGDWRKCSICKKPIQHSQVYQKCSVSSCRKSIYCTVKCWDVHVPVMNHKSAWAEEERAPSTGTFEPDAKSRRRIVSPKSSSSTAPSTNTSKEVLIVISKMKSYIKDKEDMNTSGDVGDALSDIVRYHIDGAIDKARSDGRKTVMGKDFSS
jgi:hypothetical protein